MVSIARRKFNVIALSAASERTSTKGVAACNSHATKANKAMTVTQPDTLSKVGKLIRTISSALIVMENSNRPMTSRCAMKKDTVMRCSCFASGSMLAHPSTIVMMPTNTLTKKVERHPKKVTNRPPNGGPTAMSTSPTIARMERTNEGGSANPMRSARLRTSSMAAG